MSIDRLTDPENRLVVTIGKGEGQKLEATKRPPRSEWVSTLWYVHTVEYCSAVKRNELLMHVTTWVTLKIR